MSSLYRDLALASPSLGRPKSVWDDIRDMHRVRAEIIAREADRRIEDISTAYDSVSLENAQLKTRNDVLLDKLDTLERDVRALKLTSAEAEKSEATLRTEVSALDVETSRLKVDNARLEEENCKLQSRIDCLVTCPPCVSPCVSPCAPSPCLSPCVAPCVPSFCPGRCERIEWRIFGMTSKFRTVSPLACLSSPTRKCVRLPIERIELDFYPNGAAGAPPRGCSVVIRCTRGTTLTFQVFMGCKRSATVTHSFTGWAAGGYRHDFPRVREEVEPCDDAICLGLDIFSCSKNGRTWVA
uniref:MATH domain-containing protein n=1 Tax=Chromera velia CCMP2878 TaxID=1169474 RepID=A0A0G4F452_9ALVE|eukprot:Cvel_14926.t1-p1 / transcript=Cvel_14926.t1 / gene=Cvel_14926 / organism=Chromera_velia_CCMP2878 / gene_product=hypothetical protein / transcript_product=hypothetical protein / location=Cvel_scaffold1082:21925-24665(-) / protein_length=296 / sequence_SO=supercontig / SO=protein_coding / is_pseudo=false